MIIRTLEEDIAVCEGMVNLWQGYNLPALMEALGATHPVPVDASLCTLYNGPRTIELKFPARKIESGKDADSLRVVDLSEGRGFFTLYSGGNAVHVSPTTSLGWQNKEIRYVLKLPTR